MAILLLYGTTHGHTRKIATFMAGRLAEAGHQVVAVDSADIPDEIEVDAFEVVIVAASLYANGFQPAVVQFVTDHHHVLASRPSAFVSVSLSAAGDDPEDRRSLVRRVVQLRTDADWSPTVLTHVGGALPDGVDHTADAFLARWMARAGRAGGERDQTDWVALAAFVDDFVTRLEPVAVSQAV